MFLQLSKLLSFIVLGGHIFLVLPVFLNSIKRRLTFFRQTILVWVVSQTLLALLPTCLHVFYKSYVFLSEESVVLVACRSLLSPPIQVVECLRDLMRSRIFFVNRISDNLFVSIELVSSLPYIPFNVRVCFNYLILL